jgi:hypothetical protein
VRERLEGSKAPPWTGGASASRSTQDASVLTRGRLLASCVLAGWVACSVTTSWAASAAVSREPPDVRAALADASRLERAGANESAIELLKRARQLHPDQELLVLALARAYVADKNDFWALNVLSEHIAAHPPACQARAFAGWVELREANLDRALEVLAAPPECLVVPELHTRLLLLRALVADQRAQTGQVVTLLDRARALHRIYAEDQALLANLTARYQRGRLPLVAGEVAFGVGFATNGIADSPVDLETPEQSMASPLGFVDARARVVIPALDRIRPVLGVGATAQQLADAASELSHQHLFAGAGALFGYERPRLQIQYEADAVATRAGAPGDSGSSWYSQGHRAKYELEASDHWVAFGSVGYRSIRERERSRVELEQGLGFTTPLTGGVHVLAAASARGYEAESDAYDQMGATLETRLDVALPRPFVLREALAISGDMFPSSEGFFAGARGHERRDLLVRASAGLWASLGHSLQSGLEYSYANRDSSASAYAFSDHRVLLRWTVAFDSDQLLSHSVPSEGRVTLETGSKEIERLQGTEPSVRELVRQNDAAQRASSCSK